MAISYSRKMPDHSRNTALAGKTVYTNGMNVTYNENGYVTTMVNPHHPNYAGTTKSVTAQPIEDALAGKEWTEPDTTGLRDWNGGIDPNGTDASRSSGSESTPTGRMDSGYGGSYSGGYGSAYDGGYGSGYGSGYLSAYEAQKAANDAAVQLAVDQLTAQKTTVNDSYDDYARQAYIDKMTAARNIDQYLGARGVTGGAAESTILGLNTSYADELRKIEQSRRETVSALDQAISEARLTGDLNNAKAAAEAAQEQASLYAQEMAERKAAAAAQEQYERAEAQEQQSWARSIAAQMLAAGRMPDDATLAAAGLTRAQAELLLTQAEEAPAAYTPTFTQAQIQAEINRALKYGTPLAANVLRDYEYYYGEPYYSAASSTASYSGGSGGTSSVSYNNSGYSTAQVKLLQQWFRSQGYDIAADGYWGPASQSVTKLSSAAQAMNKVLSSKNAGIPQSLIDEINRNAEGGMSVQNLKNLISGWVNSGRILQEQGDWLRASFGF